MRSVFRIPVAVLLVLALFLSGCLGADPVDPGETRDEGKPRTTPTAPTSTTGVIQGTVASDLMEPIANVRVTLFNQARTESFGDDTTNRDGTFTFNDILPGSYILQARRDGYQTGIQGTHVKAGEVTTAHVRLMLLPTADPYVIEEDIVGFLEWAYWYQVEVPGQGCVSPSVTVPAPDPVGNVTVGAASCSGSRSAYSKNFRGVLENIIDNETKTILFEVQWAPAGVLGEFLQLWIYCAEGTLMPSGNGDRTHPCFHKADVLTSPIYLRVDEEHWLENEYDPVGLWQWHIHSGYGMLGTYPLIGADVGVAYGQEYTVYISIFQRAHAPGDYSRLPDS